MIIPVAPGRRLADTQQAYAKGITVYKIRRGDTVEKVADNFGVSPTMVRRWNHLHGDNLGRRHILYVHLPVSPNADATSSSVARKSPSHSKLHNAAATRHHVVKSGETLTSIATSNHTTVSAIKRDNGDLALLRPGMVLVLRDTP